MGPVIQPSMGAVWVLVQLVSAVAATTQPSCQNLVVTHKRAESQNGDALCATAPAPNVTVTTRVRIECGQACVRRHFDKCAAGFNYRQGAALCEMFANPPTALQVQPNCEYYGVCSRFKCVSCCILLHCVLLCVA